MKSLAEIRRKIESLSTIPTIPAVLTNLLAMIDSEGVSVKQIGDLISKDQALSARLLKMVNSPVYGFPGRISSVNQALMLVGFGALKGMLMGVAIFDAMQNTMIGLWEHSIGSAIAARLIAAKIGRKETEDISVAALIHDLGKVAFGTCYPEEYKFMIGKAKTEERYIVDVEREYFGVNHAEAGAWIATKWSFPSNLIEAISCHHKPRLAKETKELAAIVHLSDIIIKMIGFGFSGDPYVHQVDGEAWKLLGFNDEDLKDILSELEDAISGGSLAF